MTRRLTRISKPALLSTLIVCCAMLGLRGFNDHAAAQSAAQPQSPPQSPPQSQLRLPSSISIGPRLIEYPIECIDSRACEVRCHQHGVEVFKRAHILQTEQVRMLASTNADGEIIPRWLEIRAAAGGDTRTVLLSRDTSCDLQALVISPDARP